MLNGVTQFTDWLKNKREDTLLETIAKGLVDTALILAAGVVLTGAYFGFTGRNTEKPIKTEYRTDLNKDGMEDLVLKNNKGYEVFLGSNSGYQRLENSPEKEQEIVKKNLAYFLEGKNNH
ncbi:hypothetical protein GOV14_03940 [Candidatus Pacearchaeota archaeon]|nr:hypothetical protein [Candidatus Pacearchaeota archaeon]